MKLGAILGIVVVALAIAFGVYMIDIDQTQEAKLPDVDVSVEGGQAPEFDAEVGDIDVGTEEVTVTVPDVDIQAPGEDEEVAEETSGN